MLSIQTNRAAMSAANRLGRTQENLGASLRRVSSGKRINNAANDAAGLGVAVNLETSSLSLRAAMRNANDGIRLVQVAEQAADSSVDILQRMRELAVQSSSETLGNDERAYLQTELAEHIDQLLDTGRNVNWNGIALGDALTPTIDVQVGTGATSNDVVTLQMPNLRGVWAAVRNEDISTLTGGRDALTAIDSALDLANTERAELGAGQNRLEAALENAQTSDTALTGARSRILDTDFAVETSHLTRLQIMQSAGVASLAQSKNLSQGILGLL